jgi:hypothetical protein
VNTTEPVPDICAAPDELLALARAVRPAWDHDILAAALLAASQSGWTWDRTLAETVRLMRSPDGSPWDLKRAAADPFRRPDASAGLPRSPEVAELVRETRGILGDIAAMHGGSGDAA